MGGFRNWTVDLKKEKYPTCFNFEIFDDDHQPPSFEIHKNVGDKILLL